MNSNPRKIYVSNISRDTRERDLGRLFEECGRIERLQFKNRFAFIEFETGRDSEDAVHKFDGMYFMGRRLRVETYQYRGGDRKYRSDNYSNDFRVFISNLDSMTSWQDLKDFGRTAGKSVTFADVRVVRNGDYNSNRRKILEGIIEYSDKRDYENALKELDGARLNGVRVKVYSKSSGDRSKFSEENDRDRDRSNGGRSRSRDRDRRNRGGPRDRDRVNYRSNRRGRSRSRSYSRSNSRRKSRSRSRSRQNRRDRDRNPSKSRSRTRSKTPPKNNGNINNVSNGNDNHKSPSKSPSHTPQTANNDNK